MGQPISDRHDALDALAAIEPRIPPSIYSITVRSGLSGWEVALQGDSIPEMKALARLLGGATAPVVRDSASRYDTEVRRFHFGRIPLELTTLANRIKRVDGRPVASPPALDLQWRPGGPTAPAEPRPRQ